MVETEYSPPSDAADWKKRKKDMNEQLPSWLRWGKGGEKEERGKVTELEKMPADISAASLILTECVWYVFVERGGFLHIIVDVAVCSNTQLFAPLLRLPPTKTHTHQMTWPRPAQTLAKTITWTKSFSQAWQVIKTLLHLWAWRETWMRRRMQINMQVPGMWQLTNMVESYNNLSY